jgi:hypothetical protein
MLEATGTGVGEVDEEETVAAAKKLAPASPVTVVV